MRSPDSFSVLGGVSDSVRTGPRPNTAPPPTQYTSHATVMSSYSGKPKPRFSTPINKSFITSPPPSSFVPIPQVSGHVPLSIDARRKLELALSHGWSASTLKGYDSNVKQFLRWCEGEQIPQELQFPADEFILCAFAASDVGRLGGGTARKKISAIKAWHAAHNMTWNGSKRLSYILSGVERLSPDSSKLPPRPPISAHMLRILAESLDESSGFDAVVLACSLVAFWGQCRLGELLSTNGRNFSTSSIPARHNLRVSRKNSASTVRILHLPRTKVQQVRGEDVILTHQSGALDPILALTRHFQLNVAPTASPLFTYRSVKSGGRLRVLTKTAFLQRCNEVWSKHGFPTSTGHSFRIGGTTELLLGGVPPKIVKAMGRWSSDAFLRYWRSLEDIAPLHALDIHHPANRFSASGG